MHWRRQSLSQPTEANRTTRASIRTLFNGVGLLGLLLGSVDQPALAASDYREPSAAVTRLLTAAQPPEPLLHATSGHIALLHREPVISLERLTRPRLGLAGYRFDPRTGTSGVAPLITHVELVSTSAASAAPVLWQPPAGALFDVVRFSPDGSKLVAVVVDDAPARLAIFDVTTGRGRVLDVPINPAWGEPCRWIGSDELMCRLLPETRPLLPAEQPAPMLIEHHGGAAPIRTYPNLLENSYEDQVFEHYFTVELGRVGVDGDVARIRGLSGLLTNIDPSPDGAYVVLTRLEPPYPRLVGARRFPSRVEIWNIAEAKRIYASDLAGYGVDEAGDVGAPRRSIWKDGTPPTLGVIRERRDENGARLHQFRAIVAPFTGTPEILVDSKVRIDRYGWTTAGTPWFATPGEHDNEMRAYVILDGKPRLLWSGSTAERYDTPGRAVRAAGSEGPVLEAGGRIYLAGDGLGDGGPQPFLDAFDIRTGEKERLFTAAAGVFETVLGVLDPKTGAIVTSRETETEPPRLFVVRGDERTPIGNAAAPFADLVDASREVVRYERADGVKLSGTLYLPSTRRAGERLPTLVWIYPYEFSDREHAEQLDVRSFRYHRVKGPSPLAALVEGYAVLLNPTVPILSEEGAATDDYLQQLVASVEAAVDHLVKIGVSDPARVAVGGRSYGAFSSANLLIHSEKFATAVAMSGAYNRTLTPYGFQHEYRSFWQATQLYTKISPFYFADRVDRPLLLVHGGADENGGTPPMQARRFFHALVGQGAEVRYVELPGEGHHYWARENVLLAAAELIDWLDRTIGPKANRGK